MKTDADQAMNTGEIVKRLAHSLEISEKAARLLLREKLRQMALTLQQHGSLPLKGFGTLNVNHVKAHRAYNPGKKAYVMMPERKRVSLRTSKAYREQLKREHNGEES